MGGKDDESIEENMDEEICENCHSPEAVEEGSANARKEDDRNKATADTDDGVVFNKIACLGIDKELEDSGGDDEENLGEMPIFADANDMDCEPFVDEGGPSDNDTAAENEKVDCKKEPNRKKMTKAVGTHTPVRKSMRTRCATSRYSCYILG